MSKPDDLPAGGHSLSDDPVVISVCTSCRATTEGGEITSPGLALAEELRKSLDPSGPVRLRAVQCLSVCKRPCTVALTAPGRYTYLFGDLDPLRDAPALLACAATYAEQEHGYLLWRERPEPLRRGILARIPPLHWAPEDGSHPR